MLYPVTPCEFDAVQERLTLCCGGGVPVPVNDSTAGECEALLVNETLPEAAPVAGGVNVTVYWTFCPAGITMGNEASPLNANAAPVKVSDVTVTLAPLAVSVPCSCAFVPTITLPNARVDGVTANCP